MKFSNGFRIVYWLSLVGVLTWFLSQRVEDAIAGRATLADTLVFAVWVALLLAPLFTEVELLGVKLKQAVEEAKKEIKGEIASLRNEVSTAVSVRADVSPQFHFRAIEGHISPAQIAGPTRQPLEYKVLNTLWTKQVTKFPDRSQIFTFRLNAGVPEYLHFREAASKLMGEGLVSETDTGQLYLTDAGFAYCKQHHQEFPPEQWWPEEPMNQDHLAKILARAP